MSHWQREQEYRECYNRRGEPRCYDRRGELTEWDDKVWLIPWTSADGTAMPATLININTSFLWVGHDATWVMFQDKAEWEWPSHWIVRFTCTSWLYSRMHYSLVLWWTRCRFKKGWPTIQAGRLTQNIILPDNCWDVVVTYLVEPPPKLYGGWNFEALRGDLTNYRHTLMLHRFPEHCTCITDPLLMARIMAP